MTRRTLRLLLPEPQATTSTAHTATRVVAPMTCGSTGLPSRACHAYRYLPPCCCTLLLLTSIIHSGLRGHTARHLRLLLRAAPFLPSDVCLYRLDDATPPRWRSRWRSPCKTHAPTVGASLTHTPAGRGTPYPAVSDVGPFQHASRIRHCAGGVPMTTISVRDGLPRRFATGRLP